jgi:hypothetical protein
MRLRLHLWGIVPLIATVHFQFVLHASAYKYVLQPCTRMSSHAVDDGKQTLFYLY